MEDADIWKGSIYATNVYVSTAVREFDIDRIFGYYPRIREIWLDDAMSTP
jgi:hypothetical protein